METSDILKKMVVESGFPVYMGSEYCKMRKEEGKNCEGCECGKGCDKMVQLQLLYLKQSTYIPKTFEEHLKMQEWFDKETAVILEIKSSSS